MTTIVWFRQDLRLADNPALTEAVARGAVVPVYILDETPPVRPLGGASRWWLHNSLTALRKELGGLVLLRGDPRDILPSLIRSSQATAIYWNRCYEPYAVARDTAVKAELSALGLDVQSFNASLLHEPWDIRNAQDQPYKVFTAFWRAASSRPVAPPLPKPKDIRFGLRPDGDPLETWKLTPTRPDWAEGWDRLWQPGEAGARRRLDAFVAEALAHYPKGRDRPDQEYVSRLSPHLHFGEISPRQLFARMAFAREQGANREGVDKFLSEIGWREFAYHLLYHFPSLPQKSWRVEFERFPWRDGPDILKAWQRGQTGYPIVDSGMRQLWRTGYMHNRVRMIVASFLTKHLLIDWRHGEAWFWDTLVDADLANNSAGWQWVAGSGADAAPYFRIYNPVKQGEKFDPEGEYVRRWCLELRNLPNEHVHAPFDAPEQVLAAAGLTLGRDYPLPVVELDAGRKAALAAYRSIRQTG
jgi:deoxyribodipyrimidine photo-lyase